MAPLTLATQMTLSPQGNSLAWPEGGSSDWVVSLTKGIEGTAELHSAWTGEAPIPTHDYRGCKVCAIMTWRLNASTMFGSSRTSVGLFARVI